MPSLKEYGIYDLAISFLMPHNIVLNKVAAKKKLAWIHTDYSAVYLDKKIELPIWSQFDHVVSISESVTKSFISVMPKLKDKIIQIENILSPHFIKQQSIEVDVKSELRKDDSEVIICSVGRLSYQKNFDQAVYICKYLVEMGFNIKWYIIGDGGEENFIKNNILLAGMQNHFFLLGKKANPYPYIKACDIYVQTSSFEGLGRTLIEASILNKPIVTTNFPTAYGILENEETGLIVEMNAENIATSINRILQNEDLRLKLINNLTFKKNISEQITLQKVYNLLNA